MGFRAIPPPPAQQFSSRPAPPMPRPVPGGGGGDGGPRCLVFAISQFLRNFFLQFLFPPRIFPNFFPLPLLSARPPRVRVGAPCVSPAQTCRSLRLREV